ncbi:S-adenosyl-L-methionine-dependent methyltransferase [Lepidopterella palustris CBS 459.81]|uniref:S-adenosyl-L-methionine-dependent methyltransferase n=1 Tax=Lepidopterella palustris CBS 459.81 TaxID=1314670 RepID=A0A8E2JD27_9PEZI|nr:S-adenosyl-L-methionine-dependent methyltransferase [Lepidopterella palustris CBS 459.81]
MPRLAPQLLRHARKIDPLLPLLLRPCRDLVSAQNELRWLREHAIKTANNSEKRSRIAGWRTVLRQLVEERTTGKPLQYILGTEYFGDLEIVCYPGVLIPRQETAASVTHLVDLLRQAEDLPSELRVLDLCTGTGCIPLLFQHEFNKARHDKGRLRLLGVDISPIAVRLARYNHMRLSNMRDLQRQERQMFKPGRDNDKKKNIAKPRYSTLDGTEDIGAGDTTEFMSADVLMDPLSDRYEMDAPPFVAEMNFENQPPFWDILISNPPYISPSAFNRTTTHSVRVFEPKLALVPPPSPGKSDEEQGDSFYPRLLTIANQVEAKLVLFEVADLEQAIRVARMARDSDKWDGVEIWRDQPELESDSEDEELQEEFEVVGQGNGRSVLCWRGPATQWLGKPASTIFTRRTPKKVWLLGQELEES